MTKLVLIALVVVVCGNLLTQFIQSLLFTLFKAGAYEDRLAHKIGYEVRMNCNCKKNDKRGIS